MKKLQVKKIIVSNNVKSLREIDPVEKALIEKKIPGQKGERGIQGEKGLTGDAGANGPIGPIGLYGRNGEPGKSGINGLKGVKGERGSQGQIGHKGEKGVKGKSGEQGRAGFPGVPGPKGDKGDKGDTGPKGERGDKGFLGPMPKHQWQGTRIRFQITKNEWGDWVDLKAEDIINLGIRPDSPANVTRLTQDATLNSDHEIIAGNTDSASFSIFLPKGLWKTHYRLSNTGLSGNVLTIVPNGTDLLYRHNESFDLIDGETIDLYYVDIDGWF